MSEYSNISVADPETLGNLCLKVLHLHAGLELGLKEQVLSHQALQEALNDPKNGESAVKHLKQQVCLVIIFLSLLGCPDFDWNKVKFPPSSWCNAAFLV